MPNIMVALQEKLDPVLYFGVRVRSTGYMGYVSRKEYFSNCWLGSSIFTQNSTNMLQKGNYKVDFSELSHCEQTS